MRVAAMGGWGSGAPRYSRDAVMARCALVVLGGLLLTSCGGGGRKATVAVKAATVGAEVKRHIEALNPSENVGISSVSCEQRGPVPSMGTNAVAFLCSIHATNGEATKPQLWAYLPSDNENHVELLDETAERELASRGELAGLNDGHSEADNRSAESDIRHAGEVSQEASSQQTSPEASVSTSGESMNATDCGVLTYRSAYWSLGERWRITDSATLCSEAMQVIRDDFGGEGINHSGNDNAESYKTVNGWRCFGPETGSIGCTRGTQHISGSELRSASGTEGK
jgi:hypothetical protein